MWVGILVALLLMLECFPIDLNITSLGNREYDCLNVAEHITDDEKYECVIWKEFIRCSRMVFGSVYYENFKGSFLGVLYLYL
jgi:hypothetical protein